jgi:hypothetical protein
MHEPLGRSRSLTTTSAFSLLSVEKLSDVPEYERRHMIRIRTEDGVAPELKDVINRAVNHEPLDAEDAQVLSKKRFENIHEYLFTPMRMFPVCDGSTRPI